MVAPVATRRSGWSLAFALAGALHPVEATAKVASAPLAEVVAGAAVIVVAKDVAVRKVGKVRVGRAAVVRVLKGDPHLKEVLYLADPTWACDAAEVKVGQRSLLSRTSSMRSTVRWERHDRLTGVAGPPTRGFSSPRPVGR